MSATTDATRTTDVTQAAVDADRHDILAGLVLAEFAGVGAGHCARVNYLDGQEARAICLVLRERAVRERLDLDIWVLGGANDEAGAIITSDRAIELRNDKPRPLCLFVPPNVIDSAASSLANSFATIDGRTLQVDARTEALKRSNDPLTTSAIQTVLQSLRGKARPADRNVLDFVLAGNLLSRNGQGDRLGRELWRVGLIADAEPDFLDRLSRNREVTRKLARSNSASSGLRERIADTQVDAATARRVQSLLTGQQLTSPQVWSERLLADGLTFDTWVFPEEVRAEVSQVTVTSFRDRTGKLLTTYRKALEQRDGAGSNLFLVIRQNEKTVLPVKWTSDPVRTDDVAGWRVALLPLRDTEIASTGLITSSTSDTGDELDLPTKDVKGDKRDVRLTLTLDIDTEPEYEIVARVVAIDGTGAEIRNADGEVVAGFSDPFFIRLAGATEVIGFSERRRTVASLAEGRLVAAIDARAGIVAVDLSEPEWRSVGEISYFSLKTDPRTRVTVGLSSLLVELERDILREPAALGRWSLALDEVRAATRADIAAVPAGEATSDLWVRFHGARKTFFEQLAPRPRKGASPEGANPRDLVEIAEWTSGQQGAVIRYAQAYRALLDGLAESGAAADELRLALSVDTLSIRIDGRAVEPAVMVLPTHPLRALWLASHHELLRHWQERALEIPKPARRKELIDRDLVHDLRPVNVPAFAYGSEAGEPFVFFRNLGFASGVALPAGVQDPVRRFLDLAQVLGFPDEPVGADDRAPERLKAHLERFAEVHPYADPLQIALVNPDRGDLLAAALGQSTLFRGDTADGANADDQPVRQVPLLDVSAYVLDGEDVTRTNLSRLRQTQGEAATRHPTDFLYPRLSTTVQPLSDLLGEDGAGPPDLAAAHLAVVADLCRPTVATAPVIPDQDVQRGNSLHGLLTRFHGSRTDAVGGADSPAFRWRYRAAVPKAQRVEPHPVDARFGTALAEGQTAMLRATAAAIAPGERNAEPVIEVTLTPDLVRLLESLHDQTDWVVTIDRFFGIDYFDSPRDPALASLAHKHVIDYSPEFVDGLGHRMIVTTAWRAEIESILRRAMDDSGFSGVDASVRVLLGILKTVSGRLALQALTAAGASQAVGLAVTLLWLRAKGRLQNAVLIPVDVHQDVFSRVKQGDRSSTRCDLLLIEFRSGFVNLSLIEVKNRRGPLAGVDSLTEGMRGQLRATSEVVIGRFFNPDRVDASLQRAVLGNIARFYVDRSERYGLVTPESGQTIRRMIAQYERSGAEVRSERHDGVIVSLNDAGRPESVDGEFRVTVLTAAAVERFTELADIAIEPGSAHGPEPEPASVEDDRSTGSDGPEAESDASVPGDHPGTTGQSRGESTESSTSREHGEGTAPDRGSAPSKGSAAPDVGGAGDATATTVSRPPVEDGRAGEVAVSGPVSVQLGRGPRGPIIWLPDVKGSPHLFITGIPGQGKSVTTRTLIADLATHGVPSLIFDFHGEYADDVRTWAPATGALSHPHVADASEGLPFSPFEVDGANPHQSSLNNAQAIAEIFGYVRELGPIQQDTLMTTIRDAYRAGGYADPASESQVLPTMNDILRRLVRREQDSQVKNILARCRPLLEFDLFRPDPDGLGFQDLIRDGLVVRLDRLMSEEVQTAAGAFLIRKVYRDMFHWGRPDRIRLAVVLDEAHRLALDATLPKLLKEGRKYGVLVIAASQGLSDFHKDVLGNVGTKIAFRSNHPDSRKVAGFFSPAGTADLPGQIEQLGVGQAIVQTPEMAQAARVEMRSARAEPGRPLS